MNESHDTGSPGLPFICHDTFDSSSRAQFPSPRIHQPDFQMAGITLPAPVVLNVLAGNKPHTGGGRHLAARPDLVRGKPRRSGRGRIAQTAEPFFGFISVRCLLLLDVLAHEKKDHVDVHLENTVPLMSNIFVITHKPGV